MPFEIYFPEVSVFNFTANYADIASPKAIAFQTYKSEDVWHAFRKNKSHHQLSAFFCKQISINQNDIGGLALPKVVSWISYPFAIKADLADQCCAVFKDNNFPLCSYRNVRLYRDQIEAFKDNDLIFQLLRD